MDVPLNNEEFIKCKRSVIIYLEAYCSQACAYCSQNRLSATPRSSCSACFGQNLVWLCSRFPRTCSGLFFLFFVLFLVFAEAHLDCCCMWCESTVPLPRGGPGDSPPEQGQDKALSDPGVCPPPLRAFCFLNCCHLGSMHGLRPQTTDISISKYNCPCCRSSVALKQLLVKPAEGRWKIEGSGHWKCRLSLLAFSFRWSSGRNSKPLM